MTSSSDLRAGISRKVLQRACLPAAEVLSKFAIATHHPGGCMGIHINRLATVQNSADICCDRRVFMRQYDFEAAQRVNHFIANSKETARRIKKFYRRDSTVIYPPIEISKGIPLRTQGDPLRDYYLFVSRPVGGKGLELAVAATKKLGVQLKVVGAQGGAHVSDIELSKLYAGAKAFLALATDEDFGMTPVEAMSMGTPVIAYRGGGYTESIIDGKTGILFDDPSADGLIKAIQRFEKIKRLAK